MAQQPQQDNNNEIAIAIFLLIFIGGGGYLLWPTLKEFFLTIKLYQMELIARAIPTQTHLDLLYQLKHKEAYRWTMLETAKLGYVVNYYFLPLIFLFAYSVLYYVKNHLYIIRRYNKIMKPIDLFKQEIKVWKFLAPVAHLDLLNQDPTKGPWASAKKPQEVAIELKLLNNPKDLTSLNKDKALKYFAMQLGLLYRGVEHLNIYEKALFGCFAAQYMEQNDDCYYALMEIAESFGEAAKGKHDFSAGLKLYEEYKDNPKVLAVMNKHAYVSTALARLFAKSGDKGINISRYFIWLKATDRRLYYMLNCIGREKPFVENGGIYSHYQYEVAMNRPLIKMFVEEAVKGMEDELSKVKLRTDD